MPLPPILDFVRKLLVVRRVPLRHLDDGLLELADRVGVVQLVNVVGMEASGLRGFANELGLAANDDAG